MARPGSEHFEPGYVDAFRSSYNAVIEKPLMELSPVEEKVLSIVANLRGIRFFWDCGRLLHLTEKTISAYSGLSHLRRWEMIFTIEIVS